MSPIGDALNRARQVETTIGTDANQLASAETAGELAKMAETDSELSRQIDAQLSGAKVRFDGAAPTITPAPDAPPASKPDPPRPSTSAPDSGGVTMATAGTGTRAQAADPGRAHPARPRDLAPALGTGSRSTATKRSRRKVSGTTFRRAAPFILILIIIVSQLDRMTLIVGGMFAIVAGLVLLYVLLKMSKRTGRKTTQMPKDDQFNRRR